jgi:TonB family protein
MKIVLPFLVVAVFLTASAQAQIVLPTRPAGAVLADHSVVTRDGPNDYLMTAPAPLYPANAARASGRGLFVMDLSMLYGTVEDVRVVESTGSPQLDNAAIEGLRQWTFRRYTVYKAAVPVTFDASGRVHVGADPGSGPEITAILAYLGQVPTPAHKASTATKHKSR